MSSNYHFSPKKLLTKDKQEMFLHFRYILWL